MFNQLISSRFLQFILACALVLMATSYASAQQPAPSPSPVEVTIKSASATRLVDANQSARGWEVIIVFSTGFNRATDSAQVKNPSNYKIINAKRGSQVPISEADFDAIEGAIPDNLVTIKIAPIDALNADDSFYLFATNLHFNGVKPKSTPMHEIEVPTTVDPRGQTRATTEQTDAVPKPVWGLSASKGKNDSDVYGAYELTKARGIATTGSGDLKVAIPFFSNFWNRTSKFSPLVEFKASSDANADPDSFKFALEWFLPLHVGENPNATFPYTAVNLINSGKIEAPKNFNNINALWESKWLFPSSHFSWNSKKFRMFLDPYVGHELGKNLKSPLKEADGKGIARLMVGADLTIRLSVKNLSALKGFEFTSSYVRRWPLKRELLVNKDDDGNLVALTLSKGPKDYSDSKLIFKVNDYFGPYIGYEWGRLPPNYELVDHKWTFGLLFKSKVRAQ